jgi:YVTN family beta-propeller protein
VRRWRVPKFLPAILAIAALAGCGQGSTGASASSVPGKLVAQIAQSTPRDVNAGFGSIWVSNGPSNTVTRIDPTTDSPIATIALDNPPSVLAVSQQAVWVTSFQGVSVIKIDPATNRVVGRVNPGGQGPVGVTVFDGYVWVANHDGRPTGSVAKIDPDAMKVVDLIYVGFGSNSGPTWIAHGAGSLWVGVPNADAVFRIDPIKDSVVAKIHDRAVNGEIVAGDRDIWVAGGDSPGVAHIDPARNTLTQVKNESGIGGAIAVGGGFVWFGADDQLDRIDTTTQEVTGSIDLPGSSFGAIVAFGDVWLTDKDEEYLYKVQPA